MVVLLQQRGAAGRSARSRTVEQSNIDSPDALPFQGTPHGQFLGYSWMALPFTDPSPDDPPTGEQCWTCFLNAANFKDPITYYIPETWSKNAKLLCAEASPYHDKESGRSFFIEMLPATGETKPIVAGFHFNGGFYKRVSDR